MHRMWMLAGLLLLAWVPSSHAAVVVTGIGPRVGFSTSPDQLVLGGHVVIGEVAPSVTFDPNLELGFGDHESTVGVNFDLHYHFALKDTEWRPYVGAGLGINFISVDRKPPFEDESTTGVGGELILGAGVPTRSGNRFFGELKLGLGDTMASLKMIAGWNFKI